MLLATWIEKHLVRQLLRSSWRHFLRCNGAGLHKFDANLIGQLGKMQLDLRGEAAGFSFFRA